MKINANEVLLLNKKIKFGENTDKNAIVKEPPIETNIPQAGLNALTLKGLNNVVGNPMLATTLKMDEKRLQLDGEKNETAGTVAFQGLPAKSKIKHMAVTAMVALASLGLAGTLQSCDPQDIYSESNITVNIDMNAVTAMMQQMIEMQQQMLEQQKITNEQMQQNNAFMKELLNLVQQGNISSQEFYTRMFDFIATSTMNQEVIINILVQNGMDQKEAIKKLDEILTAVRTGNKTVEDGMKELMDMLNDIKGILSQIMVDFNKFYQEMLNAQKELMNTNKEGFEQLIANGDITNATLKEMKSQNDSLLVLDNKQLEALENIGKAIEKSNIDNNANFDKVVETLNLNKKDLIGVLVHLGYKQEEITKMTASQILAAINDNTVETKLGNALLYKITEQIADLPNQLKQGNVTQEQIEDFYALFKEIAANQGQYSKEMLEKMQTLFDKLAEISGTLDDISAKLTQFMNDFTKYANESTQQRQDLMDINKNGFEELLARGEINSAILNQMAQQNKELLDVNNKQLEALENIGKAIEKSNIDNNANFDKVVETLNVNKKDLIGVLVQLGYQQKEITKMTASQILAAINDNTVETKLGNALLYKITEQIADLPNQLKLGNISKEDVENFYALFKEIAANQGQYSKEILDKMQVLLDKLTNIQGSLDEINQKLSTLVNEFQAFRNDYTNDKKVELKLFEQLIKDNQFQTNVIIDIATKQKEMIGNLSGIEKSVNALLEITKDDTKHKELIDAIKKIQAGGTANIDYDKLEGMFKALGLTITDAVNMSSKDLEQIIKNFQKDYIETEKTHTQQLDAINKSLEELQMFNGLNKDEIIEAIKNLNVSVENGNADVTTELKMIQGALETLQATVNGIYTELANHARDVEFYLGKWDAKFDGVLQMLDDFKAKLSTIISNQKTAEVYLKNMLEQVNQLKIEIQKWEGSTGGNFDYDKFEQMWQKHDQANYERYSKLIQDLGIDKNDLKSIEDLLGSIDSKMDYLKGNSDILNVMVEKIAANMNKVSPETWVKLEALMNKYKCNCECGGNNEGILGELDEILG